MRRELEIKMNNRGNRQRDGFERTDGQEGQRTVDENSSYRLLVDVSLPISHQNDD